MLSLKLEYTIWRWQFGCKDVCTPEFADTFDWSVKNKSIQEGLFNWMSVCSFINWEKPFEEVSENNFAPSVVLMSWNYQ